MAPKTLVEVPLDAHTNMWAHRDPEIEFHHIHHSDMAVSMCGSGPIVEVCVTLDPAGKHWGWWDAERKWFTMIFHDKMLVDMCFPYGSKAAEELGRGRVAQLRVEACQHDKQKGTRDDT